LPYNLDLLTWLKQQHAQGRKLILCTASDSSIASAISNHLGVFDEVLASNGTINLAGKQKAILLAERFGHAGFDYAGNSHTDLAIWQCARKAILVNAKANLAKQARKVCEIEQIFPSPTLNGITGLSLFRIHQWLKNLLLFVPLFAAHQLNDAHTWLLLILAFFAFSFCASSVYIVNDLLDLESDRQHPRKCKRPFAAGLVPVWIGVILAPILLFISFILAYHVNPPFLFWLFIYFVVTCGYSFGIKRLILVDCLTLAMLYTLRIVAGVAVANMKMSFWFLTFAVFLFLSLAFVKRYAELQSLSGKQTEVHGRGYYTTDAHLIQTMGVTSGYAAVLVLALYLNSKAVVKLYQTPAFLWGAVIIMLFWVNWMWMQAHRGTMHDDPLVFAMKDKASLFAGLAFITILIIGTVGLS
jgi:4-hydroxybenzoate polyprenyltransferase